METTSVDRFVGQADATYGWIDVLVSSTYGNGVNPDDPREIAETVLFLASDGAGYINGQVIHVEGGWLPAGWHSPPVSGHNALRWANPRGRAHG